MHTVLCTTMQPYNAFECYVHIYIYISVMCICVYIYMCVCVCADSSEMTRVNSSSNVKKGFCDGSGMLTKAIMEQSMIIRHVVTECS